MKTLIYLIGLVAVGLAIAWFWFWHSSETVYYRTVNMFASTSETTVGHAQDVKNTGSRFADVIKNNYNDQDMTRPMVNSRYFTSYSFFNVTSIERSFIQFTVAD